MAMHRAHGRHRRTPIPPCCRSRRRTSSSSTATRRAPTTPGAASWASRWSGRETGRVVPEFFHLFPAFGAYLFQAMGVEGALATPPVFGVLGTLAAFFALRRLFGPAPALLGALLLCLNVRAGLVRALPGVGADVAVPGLLRPCSPSRIWEERRAAALRRAGRDRLGLSLLVRIDSVLLLAACVAAWIGLRRAQGDLPWRDAARAPRAASLVLAAHAVSHAAFWSRKYLLEHRRAARTGTSPPAVWLARDRRRHGRDPRSCTALGRPRAGPADRPRARGPRRDRRRGRRSVRVRLLRCGPRCPPGRAPTATTPRGRGREPRRLLRALGLPRAWPRTTRSRSCAWAGS